MQLEAEFSPDDTLYFHHIPKTAGMTFYKILEQFFAPQEICPAWLWEQLLELPREQALGFRAYRGHFFAYLEPFLGRKLKAVTLLRDPVERTISHFKHVARNPHPLHEKVASQTLLEFVLDPETRPMCENFQTNYLISLDLNPAALAKPCSKEGTKIGLRIIMEHAAARFMPPQSRLRQAKSNLEKFAWIGIVERFNDSMSLLSRIFGWPPVRPVERRNVASNRFAGETFDQRTIDAIEEATALDREIYSYAQSLFQRRVDSLSGSISDGGSQPQG